MTKLPASNLPPSNTIGFYSIYTDQFEMRSLVSGFSLSAYNKLDAYYNLTFGSGFVVAARSFIKPIFAL